MPSGLFAGINSVLPQETWGPSIPVAIVSRHYSENGAYDYVGGPDTGDPYGAGFLGGKAELGATCVWDSSIHTSEKLNRVTPREYESKLKGPQVIKQVKFN